VELPEDGTNSAKTCRSDIELYLYISRVHLLVSVVKYLIQSKYMA